MAFKKKKTVSEQLLELQPQSKQTDFPKPEPKNEDQVFRNESGRPSGITVNGKTYLGLSPDDVETIAAGEARKKGGQATQAFEQQALTQRQNIAQQETLTQAQAQIKPGSPQITEQDISKAVPQTKLLDQGTAIGAGAATGIGAGILAGAKAGSLLGTAVAPGVGTAIGAAVGVIAGVGAYYSKISLSKRNDVKQAIKVAKTANTNFGQTIDALNAGLISHDEALKRWNEDKVSLYAAQANLKRDTDTNLDKFLSGGADELVQVQDYVRDLETIYQTEFMLAFAQPNPSNIKYQNQNIELE